MKKRQHPSATHLGGTFWIAESRAELVRAMPKQKNEDEVSEWMKKQKEQSLRAGNKKGGKLRRVCHQRKMMNVGS